MIIREDIASRRYGYYKGTEFIMHNTHGPAYINKIDGRDEDILYIVHDIIILETREYCEACGFSDEDTVLWLLKYGETLPINHKDV